MPLRQFPRLPSHSRPCPGPARALGAKELGAKESGLLAVWGVGSGGQSQGQGQGENFHGASCCPRSPRLGLPPNQASPSGNILVLASGERGTPLTRKSGHLDEGRGRPRAAEASGPGDLSDAPTYSPAATPLGSGRWSWGCSQHLPVLLSQGCRVCWGVRGGVPRKREGHLFPEGAAGMGVCQAKVCFLLAGRAEGGEGLPSPFSLLLPAPSK